LNRTQADGYLVLLSTGDYRGLKSDANEFFKRTRCPYNQGLVSGRRTLDSIETFANGDGHMVLRHRWLVIALAMGCVATAGQPRQERKDAQSAFEPRSEPGVGHTFLESFVGDWSVIKTFYPRNGDPVKVPGRCRQSMIHEGKFLQSELVFDQAGKQTTGLGLVGFDAQTGRFTTIWTDARSTRMSFRQSQDPFNGKEIVLYGRSLEGEGQSARRSRTITRVEDSGSRIVHRQHVIEPDGQERLIMDLVMTRNTAPQRRTTAGPAQKPGQ
jgi:hypothetical protein